MKKINEIDLLSELISIDSSNPGAFENEIVSFLSSLSNEYGFEQKIYESAVGRSNLIITIFAGTGGKLGFSGHIDTKPVGSTENSMPQGNILLVSMSQRMKPNRNVSL